MQDQAIDLGKLVGFRRSRNQLVVADRGTRVLRAEDAKAQIELAAEFSGKRDDRQEIEHCLFRLEPAPHDGTHGKHGIAGQQGRLARLIPEHAVAAHVRGGNLRALGVSDQGVDAKRLAAEQGQADARREYVIGAVVHPWLFGEAAADVLGGHRHFAA